MELPKLVYNAAGAVQYRCYMVSRAVSLKAGPWFAISLKNKLHY